MADKPMVEFIGEIVQIVFLLQVEIVHGGTLRRGIRQVYFRVLRVPNVFLDEFVVPVVIASEGTSITYHHNVMIKMGVFS